MWLGKQLFWGRGGLAQDLAAAVGWFTRAAAQGHGEALYNMGVLHLNGEANMPHDPAQAVQYFDRAAEADFAPAHNGLGALALNPPADPARPDAPPPPPNHTKAFEHFQKSSQAGNADAHHNLGVFYRDGVAVAKVSGWVKPTQF